jgi:hypothetical protein
VHVVSTNAVLLHCHSLLSSAIDTGFGAATLRKAAQASVKVAITSARLLPVHRVPAIAVAPVGIAQRIGVGEPFLCDRNYNSKGFSGSSPLQTLSATARRVWVAVFD